MSEAYEGSEHYGDNIAALYDLWEEILHQPQFKDAATFPPVQLRCSRNHRLVTVQLRGRNNSPFEDLTPNVVFEVVTNHQGTLSESHPGAGQVSQIGDTRTSFTCAACAQKNPRFNIPLRTRSLLLRYAAAAAEGKKSIKIDGDTLR